VRGIRGAITVEENTREAILAATLQLVGALTAANDLEPDDIAAALFSVTPDLDQAFPAEAARTAGWTRVPLMCMQEIPVAGAMPRVVRILVLANRDVPPTAIHHVYLGETVRLRADLTNPDSA
jgi:chorismate mutase